MSDRADGPAAVEKERLFADGRPAVLVVVATGLAVFAVQLDFFAVQAAIPEMADDLDTTPSALQWVISGYMLATASFLIVGGRVADIFGRRKWFLIGVVGFGVSSFLGGLAGTAEVLIAMRLVQGVAAGFMFPVALSIVTNEFRGPRVQRAVGLIFAIGAVGQAIAPLVGGVLTDVLSWRWVLWVNVPVTITVLGLTLMGVTESRDESVPRSIDWTGLVLIVASVAMFTYGIDRTSDWGWTSPKTLTLVLGGVLGLAGFVVTEMKVRHPLLDVRLFRHREFSVMTSGGSVGNMTAVIVIFLSMIFLQDIEGFDAADAGAAFMTFSLGYAFAGLISGRLERIPPWVVMTTALLLGGFGTMAMGATANLTAFIAVALVAGVGLGICWSYTSVVTQSVVPPEQAGAAAGTVLTVLISIGGIGLAIAVSILDAHTQSGASNEAEVIDNILIASGALAVVAAPFVALFGRERRTTG